jgi:hypothetical protein
MLLEQIYPEVNKKWIETLLQYESRSNTKQALVNLHFHNVLFLSELEKYVFLFGLISL